MKDSNKITQLKEEDSGQEPVAEQYIFEPKNAYQIVEHFSVKQ
jgi:hypothetical protein